MTKCIIILYWLLNINNKKPTLLGSIWFLFQFDLEQWTESLSIECATVKSYLFIFLFIYFLSILFNNEELRIYEESCLDNSYIQCKLYHILLILVVNIELLCKLPKVSYGLWHDSALPQFWMIAKDLILWINQCVPSKQLI